MTAITAFHTLLGDGPLGRHQLVKHFLRGAWRMRPSTQTRAPTLDLAVILEGLVEAPFEPLESAEAKNLSLKVVFLLDITSLKRVGDLQALSKSPQCLVFALSEHLTGAPIHEMCDAAGWATLIVWTYTLRPVHECSHPRCA